VKLILKIFKRFGAFKGCVEQKKKRCIQLVRVLIRLFLALAVLKTSKSTLCPRLFSAPPRLENPNSDEKDALFGLDTRITIYALKIIVVQFFNTHKKLFFSTKSRAQTEDL
jgi:hypothetical protein